MASTSPPPWPRSGCVSSAGRPPPRGTRASQDEVIAAYRPEIDRLIQERGYQTVDVISMHPEHPQKEALRAKFLEEHRHNEDEVRFFVAGQGSSPCTSTITSTPCSAKRTTSSRCRPAPRTGST